MPNFFSEAKPEARLWKSFKKALSAAPQRWEATRLETGSSAAGVPDLFLQDPRGHWHFVELKVSRAFAVTLRPHQISWLIRHAKGRVWVLVRSPTAICLYPGSDIIELDNQGLKLEPAFSSGDPINWGDLLSYLMKA
mgnify:FL=1